MLLTCWRYIADSSACSSARGNLIPFRVLGTLRNSGHVQSLEVQWI